MGALGNFLPPTPQVGFYINGVRMPNPTTYQWKPPASVGMTGSGKQRLFPFWELTINWDYLTDDEFNYVYMVYLGATSGATVWLPVIFYAPLVTLTGNPLGRLYQYYGNIQIDAPTLANSVDSIAQQTVKMTIRGLSIVPTPVQAASPPNSPTP